MKNNYIIPNSIVAKKTNLVLICFSHLRWDFVYQRPQHLMSNFACKFTVIFVEEPTVTDADAPYLSISKTIPNIYILSLKIPQMINADKIDQLQAQLINQFLLNYNFEIDILWYFTPTSIRWSGKIPAKAIVYDCMDELSAFKYARPELRQLEKELMCKADLVFTGGLSLYEAKRSQHNCVYLFPSSVDIHHFIKARNNLPSPADQELIPYPRLGFYGVIDERFDIKLLAELSSIRPDWNFVIIGPVVKIDPVTLPQAANIYYLGFKSYEELPYYLSGWNVALILFALNEATRFISPTKTPEYLASGRPVVSTPITDIINAFKDTSLVQVAHPKNLIDFEKAILKALKISENPDKIYKEANQILQNQSWKNTYLAMLELILRVYNKEKIA